MSHRQYDGDDTFRADHSRLWHDLTHIGIRVERPVVVIAVRILMGQSRKKLNRYECVELCEPRKVKRVLVVW